MPRIGEVRRGVPNSKKRRVTRYWLGKKQPKEMVEKRISKIRGSAHWLWKGGIGNRDYRKMVIKEECLKCGSNQQLLIHHVDGDHYNNVLENLEVLCSPCHTSIHKTEYWRLVEAGILPMPITPAGERNGQSKITEADVQTIFDLRASGLLQREIAVKLGLSQTHVGRILRGKKWGHVRRDNNA